MIYYLLNENIILMLSLYNLFLVLSGFLLEGDFVENLEVIMLIDVRTLFIIIINFIWIEINLKLYIIINYSYLITEIYKIFIQKYKLTINKLTADNS